MNVLALEDRYVSGWPGDTGEHRGGEVDLAWLLTEAHDTDVHFSPYVSDVGRRLNSDAIGKTGIRIVAAVFDVDGPDHVATDEWWQNERTKLDRLMLSHPGGFVYRTRGGYRLVYALPEADWSIDHAGAAEGWAETYMAWCAYLSGYGIEADRSCKNWNRLFRAPRVVRDGVAVEPAATLGDPYALGVWAPALPDPVDSLTREAERLGMYKAEVPPIDGIPAVAAMLGAAWPKQGSRHKAQLALAGALRKAGWPAEAAVEFLCAVCRAAGDEDRAKREVTVRDTWRKPREGVSGWGSLKAYVPENVVNAAELALHPLAALGGGSSELPKKEIQTDNEPAQPADPLGLKWGGWDEPQMPPVYLLEGLIPAGKVVTFFAEGGSVKTWSALALAIAVATGKAWLGTYPVKQGNVAYMDYEDGPYEFHRRVRYLTGGEDVPGLGYRYGGSQIDNQQFWLDLAGYVLERGITLVVVDSVSASMPGDADENAAAFAQGLKYAGRFTETGCTVVMVHHANKSGGMRGTSAVRDQSDVVFKFVPVSETDNVKRMRMECDKPGPQKRPLPVNVELTDKGLGTFKDEAQAVQRNALTGVDIKASIRLALANGPVATVEGLRGSVSKNKEAVRAALKEMVAEGEVVKLAAGYAEDSDELRTKRVLKQLASGLAFSTAGEIAKQAYVDVRFVDRLKLNGTICQSGDGRWIVVDRSVKGPAGPDRPDPT